MNRKFDVARVMAVDPLLAHRVDAGVGLAAEHVVGAQPRHMGAFELDGAPKVVLPAVSEMGRMATTYGGLTIERPRKV